jgi:Protein of unknown function (DUF3309)
MLRHLEQILRIPSRNVAIFPPDTLLAMQSEIFQRPKDLAATNIVQKGKAMGTILLILLILLLIGALPAWPYSSGWGYWPSGGLGLILLILVILALTGHL